MMDQADKKKVTGSKDLLQNQKSDSLITVLRLLLKHQRKEIISVKPLLLNKIYNSFRILGFVAALLLTGTPSLAHAAAAQSFSQIAGEIKTPRALSDYMQKNFRYVSDRIQFGKDEYWQTPEEMFQRQKGDCEDYAIFAEAVLKQNGYKTFLLSVYWGREAHTVVAYEEGSAWNLLDLGKIRALKANSVQALARAIESDWSYLGIMRQDGELGIITQKIQNRNLKLIAPESLPAIRLLSGLQNTSAATGIPFQPGASHNSVSSFPS